MTDKIEQLVEIKQAAIQFLEKEKPLNWSLHRDELERGGIMYLDGIYRIGRWAFDFKSMTLLRDADIAPEVRRYGMIFKVEEENSFSVVRDFWERERWNFEE